MFFITMHLLRVPDKMITRLEQPHNQYPVGLSNVPLHSVHFSRHTHTHSCMYIRVLHLCVCVRVRICIFQEVVKLLSTSSSDRSEWLQALEQASKAQGAYGRSPASTPALSVPEGFVGEAKVPPTWMANKASKACLECELPFHAARRRRHHCRNCGKLVCGQCSSRSLSLPYSGPAPQRVCDSCYLGVHQARREVRRSWEGRAAACCGLGCN